MKKRLGTILLEEGLIDKAQLEDALRIQRERGGRLGSILIQLGYIDADTLARILKEQLNIETVSPEEIEHLDYSVINSIPRDLVEEYQVLPVRVKDGEIEVAMLDPRNTRVLSELGFFLDKEVVPLIIPEGLLYRALKKYYNLDVEPEEEIIEEVVASGVSSHQEVAAPPEYEEVVEEVISPPSEAKRSEVSEAGPATAESEPEVVEEVKFEEVSRPEEIKVSDGVTEEEVVPPPVEEISPPAESVYEEWTETPVKVEEVTEDTLRSARSMDDLVYYLSRLLEKKSARHVIFKVQKGVAFGWVAKGEDISPGYIDLMMIPLCAPSMFKTSDETGETFFGPPPMDNPVVERFMKILNSHLEPPRNFILTPVKVQGKTVLFIYLDNGKGKGIDDLKLLPEINRIASTLSEAIERIIARKKRGS